MPEKKDEEKKPSEEPSEEEEEETFVEIEGVKYKEDPDKPGEPLKDEDEKPIPFEEEKEEPEKEPEEPRKRFPKKEQTPEEKEEGFYQRKYKKLLKEREELGGEDIEDEEEKPVTRKELSELLEKKDKESASERLLQEFLSDNPDFKKHEKKIRKYVNDPDYSNVPIGFIASGIIGESIDDEANERAELKRKADEEAAKGKSGGSTKRGVPGKKKSIWDMSKEEFEEKQLEVLQKSRE